MHGPRPVHPTADPTTRRVRSAGVRRGRVLAVALLAVSCGWRHDAVPVVEASLDSGDDHAVILTVPTCDADISTEVEERADEVQVHMRARGSSDEGCLDAVRVDLSSPLDDRPLIDATSGEPVVVDAQPELP